jgi:hypothetical protein
MRLHAQWKVHACVCKINLAAASLFAECVCTRTWKVHACVCECVCVFDLVAASRLAGCVCTHAHLELNIPHGLITQRPFSSAPLEPLCVFAKNGGAWSVCMYLCWVG